jgi:hypothetical protein
MRDAHDPSRKRSELPRHRRHESKACFIACVSTCSWLTSIFRGVTAGVAMNSEGTTTCAPMSSLFVSRLFSCCLASSCSPRAGKAHHRRQEQSRLSLPPSRSMCTEHRLPFRTLLHSGLSHCSQARVKCLGHCICKVGWLLLITTRATHLSWHRYQRCRMPMASTMLNRSLP